MPTIKINNEPHEVTQPVYEAFCAANSAMESNYNEAVKLELELRELRQMVLEMAVKRETMVKKPTKPFKLLYNEYLNALIFHVKKSVQQSLF